MKIAKIGIVLLLVLMTAGSIVSPVAAVNEKSNDTPIKKLEMLREYLTKKNFTTKQIDEIINSIKSRKHLTNKQISDVIGAYMSDQEFILSKTPQEEQEKLREIYNNHPSLPAFVKESQFSDELSPKAYEVQRDGRMYTAYFKYYGVKGYQYPGTLQVSPSGTQLHYITSHIGEPVNGKAQWIEVGVMRSAWKNSYTLHTVDSDNKRLRQR
ncbi:hypothetical protein DRO97_01240 [Archaeoglobales archaeon]|nr:MAG: hypothetical protein DRO97_01240 [Archaeoglobales archaeon]